jgi:hypothetical protein
MKFNAQLDALPKDADSRVGVSMCFNMSLPVMRMALKDKRTNVQFTIKNADVSVRIPRGLQSERKRSTVRNF